MCELSFPSRTNATETARMPLRRPAIAAGFLLTMMLFLTGCGGGEAGDQPTIMVNPSNGTGSTARLAWDPTLDASVFAYFVHYGRQSPNQSGSCEFESSLFVDSLSATITNLEPDTLYYFAVSSYNGLESVCSSEVSIVTPLPASV